MNSFIILVLSALQITLLDLVLSGDNIGVIALAIRNLSGKQAKTASVVGIIGAIGLRIFFASIITVVMTVEWLPIKLVGGLLLLKITWDLVNIKEEESGQEVKSYNNFWKAVMSIILADVSMSLDNVLAIGGAANGHIGLIVFGLLLNIPIIFFGSQLVAELMRKFKITIFVGAGILIHTSFGMIFDDRLISPYINGIFAAVFPWLMAVAVLIYGVIVIKKQEAATEQV